MTNDRKIPQFPHIASGVMFPSMTHSMVQWMHKLGRKDFILYDLSNPKNQNDMGNCIYCNGTQVVDTDLGLARCICAVKNYEATLVQRQSLYADYLDDVHMDDFVEWGELPTRQAIQQVKAQVENWIQWPEQWLTLIGAYGCGKSMLLQIIGNYYGPWALYVTMESFEQRVFDYKTAGTLTAFQAALSFHPILIIDDPGSEYNAEGRYFVRTSLRSIIKARYGMWRERPVVVATNKGAADLRAYDGLIADRILDRSIDKELGLPKVLVIGMDNIPSHRKESSRYANPKEQRPF